MKTKRYNAYDSAHPISLEYENCHVYYMRRAGILNDIAKKIYNGCFVYVDMYRGLYLYIRMYEQYLEITSRGASTTS
jgi:hypothetical protein